MKLEVNNKRKAGKFIVIQICLTLWDPMNCCLSGFSVRGILKVTNYSRKSFALSGALPDPGIKSRSSALQVDSLPSKPPGKPKQYATDNQWVKEENKRGIKKMSWDKWEWKHDIFSLVGCNKSSSKKEVDGSKHLLKNKEWSQVTNLTWYLKELEN